MNAQKAKRDVIIVALFLAIAAIFWNTFTRDSKPQATPNDASIEVTAFPWNQGRTIYAFSYEGTTQAHPQVGGQFIGEAVHGVLSMKGQLIVDGLGKEDGLNMVRFELLPDSNTTYQINGQAVEQHDGEQGGIFGKTTLIAAYSDDGEIEHFHHEALSSALYRNATQNIISELQWSRSAALNGSDATHDTPTGTIELRYTKEGLSEGGQRITGHRFNYVDFQGIEMDTLALPLGVSGQTVITFSSKGLLQNLDAREATSITNLSEAQVMKKTTALQMKRISSEALATIGKLPGARGLKAIAPGTMHVSKMAKTKMLQQRVGNISIESILDTLSRTGATGRAPHHRSWFWSATGYLQLHPEAAEAIAPLFEGMAASPRAQNLILDLLAGAGTPEAQHVMRQVLATSEAQERAIYGRQIQRFSLLASPNEKSAAFLRHAYGELQDNRGLSAVVSLGAVGRQIKDRSASVGIESFLASELSAATTLESQRALIAGFGNLGSKSSLSTLRPFLKHDDPRLKSAAIGALRKLPQEATQATVLDTLANSEPNVQAHALKVVSRYELNQSITGQLATAIGDRTIGPDLFPLVLRLIANNRQNRPMAARLIETMLATEIRNEKLKARLLATQQAL